MSYKTWKGWESYPYPSMTEKQFLALAQSDREGTLKKLAEKGCYVVENNLDEADDDVLLEEARDCELIEEVGICMFCHEAVGVDYHLYQKGFVGDDCCWDVRLKSTE